MNGIVSTLVNKMVPYFGLKPHDFGRCFQFWALQSVKMGEAAFR